MSKYQWFNQNCLSRRFVTFLLFRLCHRSYKKRDLILAKLRFEKISLNRIKRIYYAFGLRNCISVEYYSRRKNLYFTCYVIY